MNCHHSQECEVVASVFAGGHRDGMCLPYNCMGNVAACQLHKIAQQDSPCEQAVVVPWFDWRALVA